VEGIGSETFWRVQPVSLLVRLDGLVEAGILDQIDTSTNSS